MLYSRAYIPCRSSREDCRCVEEARLNASPGVVFLTGRTSVPSHHIHRTLLSHLDPPYESHVQYMSMLFMRHALLASESSQSPVREIAVRKKTRSSEQSADSEVRTLVPVLERSSTYSELQRPVLALVLIPTTITSSSV